MESKAMKSVIQTMINCIKYEVCGQNEKIILPKVSTQFFKELYKLSKAHDVAHLIGNALTKSGVFDDVPADMDENERAEMSKIKAKFTEQIFAAVYRYEKINYEFEQLKDTLNTAKIAYIPLKGSVIRKFYPEPWLRTSCDIDIFTHAKEVDNAAECLVNSLQYRYVEKWQHDISLFSPSKIHIELHFKLLDLDFKQVKDLIDVWSGEEISLLSNSEYQMSKELFLLYHIYHMAKHFIHGGCGIKPFVDLWIIKNKMGFDEGKTQKMLQGNGLLAFFERSTDLVNVWFEGKEHSAITQAMEDYILQGGVYGTLEQHLAMSQNKKGGKFKHLLSKMFLSYKSMAIYYPSLKKCPVLFPFYQVRRWCRILFCGGRKYAMNEIKTNQSLSEDKKQAAKNLIDELGL